MELRIQRDSRNINWNKIPEMLKLTSMGYYTAEAHEQAFKNSHTVIFIFDKEQMIGFGRAISDGVYQSAIYDVAVDPAYQGKGIGRMIVQEIVKKLSGCNIILYASPGKEKFYEKEGFRRLKTGMALFINDEKMKEKGFTE